MHERDIPATSRFMFWCIVPFLVPTVVLCSFMARPPEPVGWILLGVFNLLCLSLFLGLWDAVRFWWCWRAIGGIVAGGYLAYLVTMVVQGHWFDDEGKSTANALNALMGLVAFGYPGFMWAAFGRFTWKADSEGKDFCDDVFNVDDADAEMEVELDAIEKAV
ncbi:hypothetical protein LOC71_20705 [Rhodopirellula sp. JC740]|uniref:Uncharacterized protein n=1 Tax=Rhodopirellula halodulae TaxID=2894198 RepID=A0ABS8NM98_9BACT|nr:hypothetical protein [Rhodopirellula sp. JC740]MCC9644701.1 hypothetical protein [Rhodopirellula sp. JC740]